MAVSTPQEGQMAGWNVPRNYKSIEPLVREKYLEEAKKLELVTYSSPNIVTSQMQEFCQQLANTLNDTFSGFKFVCSCFAVKVGNGCFFYNTHCYWNKHSDGFICETVSPSDGNYKFLICIYVIAP
ncbi:MAG: dynein light chain Tctex-type family protein [archaeon]|nr:dynein light chain Tctex-type family protein [archaeon]